MILDPEPLLIQVARAMEDCGIPYAFTGGATIPFFLDRPELSTIRPTKDVDVVVQAVTLLQYHEVENKISEYGWSHDMSPNAPRCRWKWEGTLIDILASSEITGEFSSPWFQKGVEEAIKITRKEVTLRFVPVGVLLASKLIAFGDRGRKDPWASHDLEDIMALVDGRASLYDELMEEDALLRVDIGTMMDEVLRLPDFEAYFPGFLPGDPGSQARSSPLKKKLEAIASLQHSG
jgi:hypothetical protein